MPQTVHVYPNNDLIEHDTDGGDCPCGPTSEPVFDADGALRRCTVVHNLGSNSELGDSHRTGSTVMTSAYDQGQVPNFEMRHRLQLAREFAGGHA